MSDRQLGDIDGPAELCLAPLILPASFWLIDGNGKKSHKVGRIDFDIFYGFFCVHRL